MAQKKTRVVRVKVLRIFSGSNKNRLVRNFYSKIGAVSDVWGTLFLDTWGSSTG